MKRGLIFIFIIAACYLTGSPQIATGEGKEFPARPIEMMVPFPPGGTADIASRIVMDQFSKELKNPVTVINKPGASGTIGAGGVAKGNPDGHLLLTGNAACLIMPAFFLQNVSFDAHRDFAPLAYVGESPSVLAVQSSSPFKTMEDVINYGRKNPGKLSYATSGGLSSVSTMNMEVVKNHTGIDVAMILYEGGGPALAAILGGHVDIIATSIPTLGPQIEAGKVRVLISTKKIEEMPGVRTYSDVGIPYVVNWTGFFAPAKISKDAYNKLVAALDRAMQNPEVIRRLKDAGYIPERKTPAEISALLKEQHNLVAKIVKETKIKKK